MFNRLRERNLSAAELDEARDKRRAERAARREAANRQDGDRPAAALHAEAPRDAAASEAGDVSRA